MRFLEVEMSERESMEYDVVIVGGGPAGLASAIRLKQINPQTSVCILEKGSEVGAHILSGAVVDPKALDELLPDWRNQGCSMAQTPVTDNLHWVMTAKAKYPLPHIMMPPFMSNDGCYTGSLGNMCRWLAEQAEGLGVEIFPGFAAAEVLYDEKGAVKGVATGDMGVARDGSHKDDYQPGMELHGKYTLFAEGARGHLTKQLKAKYDLEANCQPQVYGLGMKELWDIDPDNHVPGRVIHTQVSSIIKQTGKLHSVLWWRLIIRTHICSRLKSFSAGNSIPKSAKFLKAVSAFPTGHARLMRAAGNPCQNSPFLAAH
jgi:electron-transferring-flavoprotein dehydrogenase